MSEPAVARRGLGAGPVADLVAAVAFLTRVPVRADRHGDARTGAAAFGVVGAAMGAMGAIPLLLVGGSHAAIAAVLALGTLAVLDGGLHLDGLGDTVDALAAPADRAEAARTDPRAGAAGVVAVVLVIGIDVASVADLAIRRPTVAAAAVVTAVTLSRAAAPAWALAAARFRTAARGGLGGWFAASTSRVQAAVAIATAVLVVVGATELAGPVIAAGAVAGSAIALVLGLAVASARSGLDGDGYGAIIELTVAAILVATALLG